jgi:hypothetical protein
MEGCMQDELFFSPEESPANLQVKPGGDEARKMTAGSGRRLSECFPRSGPFGRFSRILLESETWDSQEYILRWKPTVTKCRCSVFQLALSEPRTGGCDTGSSGAWTREELATWGTPTEKDAIRGSLPPRPQDTGVPLNQMLALVSWPKMADDLIGIRPSSCLARTENFVVRLTTLSAWLMGYTGAYLAHWGTASSRKSRNESSAP